MNQVAVQPAVPVLERMDIGKAEGQHRCGYNRIELLGGFPVESNHALHQPHQIIRPRADVVGDWHTRVAVMFTDKASLCPHTQMDEAGITDHDALQT